MSASIPLLFQCKLNIPPTKNLSTATRAHLSAETQVVIDTSQDDLDIKFLYKGELKASFKGFPSKPLSSKPNNAEMRFTCRLGKLGDVRFIQSEQQINQLFLLVLEKFKTGKHSKISATAQISAFHKEIADKIRQKNIKTIVEPEPEPQQPQEPLEPAEINKAVETIEKTPSKRIYTRAPLKTPKANSVKSPQFKTPLKSSLQETLKLSSVKRVKTEEKSIEESPIKFDRIRNGFKNMGQTCYIASILQLLIHVDDFKSSISSIATDKECTLYELSRLFSLKTKQDVASVESLKGSIGKQSNRFASSQQQDAHEFLQELFSQLDADFEKLSLNNSVSDTFEWTIENTIKCTKCSFQSIKVDTCRDISLDFPEKDKENLSINDLLIEFFKDETVEYKCQKCDNSSAIISHSIKALPRVLLVHLKRFAFDLKKLDFVKRLDPVQIPYNINLRKWSNHDLNFKLFSIVNHLGQDHNKGHYITDIYESEKWKTFDDSFQIDQNSDIPIQRSHCSYLLAFIK